MKSLIILSLVLLSASASFNYQLCAKDAQAFIQATKSYSALMQDDTHTYKDLSIQIENLINNGKSIMTDCPVPEQAIQRIKTVESGDCLTEVKDLANLCEKAIADYEAKNMFALVGDAEAIVKEAKLVLGDCKSDVNLSAAQPFTPKCMNDAVSFGMDLEHFKQVALNSDKKMTPELMQSTKSLYQGGMLMVQECGFNFNSDGTITASISAQCLQDISNLAGDVEKAIKDYNAKNMIALIKDAEQIIVLANKTLSDCTSENFDEFVDIALMNNPQINYEKCAKDAFNFIKACEQFIQDIQNGTASHNLPVILTDIQNIVSAAQALVNDCGLNSTSIYAQDFVNLDASKIDFEDSFECQKDINQVTLLVQQALTDLHNSKQVALINDAAMILKTVDLSLKFNCKSKFLENVDIALMNNPSINYEKCAVSAYHFGQACYNLIQDIENGTDSHNLPHIITDAQAVISAAQAVVTDCGINSTIANEFVQIDFSNIDVGNTVQCLKDIDQLALDVKQAITDFEAKNMIALVRDAEKIIVQANKTINDCTSQQAIQYVKQNKLKASVSDDLNFESCFANANEYAADLYKFYSLVASTDFSEDDQVAAVQNSLEGINSIAQSMLDKCGIQYEIPVKVSATAGSCVGDVLALGTLAIEAYKDIQKKQFQALSVALVGIISEASKAVTDCFGEMEVTNPYEGVLFACIHAMDTFTTLIEQFQLDYKEGDDFQALVQDSSNLAQYVPVLLNTCGAGKAAEFYTKFLPDSCIQSLAQTADAGYQVYEVRNNFFDILRALPPLADALESDVHTCPLLEKH